MIGALAALPLPGAKVNQGALPDAGGFDPLQELLWKEPRIEVPVFVFPASGQRLLRVSAQRYNRRGDYEKLAAVLKQQRPQFS